MERFETRKFVKPHTDKISESTLNRGRQNISIDPSITPDMRLDIQNTNPRINQ